MPRSCPGIVDPMPKFPKGSDGIQDRTPNSIAGSGGIQYLLASLTKCSSGSMIKIIISQLANCDFIITFFADKVESHIFRGGGGGGNMAWIFCIYAWIAYRYAYMHLEGISYAKFEINPTISFRSAIILLNSSDLRSVTRPNVRLKVHEFSCPVRNWTWFEMQLGAGFPMSRPLRRVSFVERHDRHRRTHGLPIDRTY